MQQAHAGPLGLQQAVGPLVQQLPPLGPQAVEPGRQLGGRQLLERSATGVRPTALGSRIYAHARQIRDELRQLERHLRHLDRLGVVPDR